MNLCKPRNFITMPFESAWYLDGLRLGTKRYEDELRVRQSTIESTSIENMSEYDGVGGGRKRPALWTTKEAPTNVPKNAS